MITGLMKEYGLDVPLYHRAILTDIAVEEQDRTIAVINVKNTGATRVEPLSANGPSAVNDNYLTAGKLVNQNAPASKIIHLLAEDAED